MARTHLSLCKKNATPLEPPLWQVARAFRRAGIYGPDAVPSDCAPFRK